MKIDYNDMIKTSVWIKKMSTYKYEICLQVYFAMLQLHEMFINFYLLITILVFYKILILSIIKHK